MQIEAIGTNHLLFLSYFPGEGWKATLQPSRNNLKWQNTTQILWIDQSKRSVPFRIRYKLIVDNDYRNATWRLKLDALNFGLHILNRANSSALRTLLVDPSLIKFTCGLAELSANKKRLNVFEDFLLSHRSHPHLSATACGSRHDPNMAIEFRNGWRFASLF